MGENNVFIFPEKNYYANFLKAVKILASLKISSPDWSLL
jgi:hypothetical protein